MQITISTIKRLIILQLEEILASTLNPLRSNSNQRQTSPKSLLKFEQL